MFGKDPLEMGSVRKVPFLVARVAKEGRKVIIRSCSFQGMKESESVFRQKQSRVVTAYSGFLCSCQPSLTCFCRELKL